MPSFSEADPIHMLNSARQPVITVTGHMQPAISISDNQNNQKIVLNGANGNLFFRADRKQGQLIGDLVVKLDQGGNLYLGGGDTDGDLVLFPANVQQDSGTPVIHLNAGAKQLVMRSSSGQNTILLDGQAGDIVLANADGAEEFEVEDGAEPGAVLVIEDEARLRVADRPYDRRVAGIVSGADGIRPGIILGRSAVGNRVPVALFGKVNCLVDASFGPVRAGDLLTTSTTRGYAMRAVPGGLAPGAVIGKALRGLAAGRGLVPVLVALQ